MRGAPMMVSLNRGPATTIPLVGVCGGVARGVHAHLAPFDRLAIAS